MKINRSKQDEGNSLAMKKTSGQGSESQTAAAQALEKYRSSNGQVEESFINELTQQE